MKRLIGTKDLPKDKWLHMRKRGLTGTDAGAITGLNPYRSAFDVWSDKLSDSIDEYDNEAMRQGRDLENYVAQRFTEETGLEPNTPLGQAYLIPYKNKGQIECQFQIGYKGLIKVYDNTKEAEETGCGKTY